MAENLPKVGSGTVTLVQKVQSCRQDKPKEKHAETHSYQWLLSLLSKESACSAEDPGLIPGSGRYPGEENGNPLQYSWRIPCTEEPTRPQSTESQESDTT